MTPDQLHDAMTFLDDDLIEATDAVRTAQKKRRLLPLAARWVAAACVCLMVGGLAFAVWRADTAELDKDITHDIADTPDLYNTTASPSFYYGNGNSSFFTDGDILAEETPDDYRDVEDTASTSARLLVSGVITAWETDGFRMTLTDSGEEVRVVFTDETHVSSALNISCARPTETDLPVGTAVIIRAVTWDSADGLTVIHSGAITPVNTQGE